MNETGATAAGPAPQAAGQPPRLSGALWVAGGMAVANLLGYALNLAASRTLGPRGFGVLAALLGLVLIGNVVALGLQTITARHLGRSRGGRGDGGDREVGYRRLYLLGLRSAVGVLLLSLLLVPAVVAVLHLDGPLPAIALALTLPSLTVTGVQLGLLQGEERHLPLAVLYVAAAAGKVGGGLVGLAVGSSVTATMIGTAAGALVAAGLGHAMVRDRLAPANNAGQPAGDGQPSLPRELMHACHALLLFFALSNVDVVLARHYLDGADAGRYAVGAVVAKGAFWFPAFVAVVALPALADGLRRRRTAFRATLAVTASGVAVTTLTAVAGTFVVHLVAGGDYEAVASRLWLFASGGSLFALAQLLLYSRIAAADRRALVPLWLSLAVLVGVTTLWRHGSVTEVVTTVVLAAGLLVVAGVVAEIQEHGRSPQAEELLPPVA